MKKFFFSLIISASFLTAFGQIVSLSPSNAGADDQATLTFDATQGNGELVGQDKVYIHHGVVVNSPDGTEWSYVIGNWGQDDGVGEMTKVSGETDKWEITFSPNIREYFGVPGAEDIHRISCVFRSADGEVKGTLVPGEYGWGTVDAGGDFFINLNAGNFVSFVTPVVSSVFVDQGGDVEIAASASSEVSSMKIWIDEGTGYAEVASVTSGTGISYTYEPTETIILGIRVTATVSGEEIEKERMQNIVVVKESTVAALPAGIKKGINYHEDETKVTLVVEAPGKEYVYVVGDFTDWYAQDEYQMNVTPDNELFWMEVTDLTPEQEYVFQYWMNENVKVGDPYADKIADPWNDSYIDETVYPNLPEYDRTEFGLASVLQTGQEPFVWDASEESWVRPDVNHLMIYELHVRDFVESSSYKDLIDTLSYLKDLGIDAIELMPVSEFEGNDSWGYNPSYYFAPDKYYGTKNDLKSFIQAAHQEGMAVILDMVLNHAFGQNPMVRMYWNNATGKPAADNPWFNVDHVGPFEWGYDFDHESDYTKAFIDSVNAYWLEEYNFDGFRFDFTKGFTNNASGGSIDGYDQSRIDILSRMADKIWEIDPDAYIILEHWGQASEETVLANLGMKMWANRSYDYVPATVGNTSGSFISMDVQSHVSYFNSHDERRIAEHALAEGLSEGAYNIKDPLIMYERVKMSAAFAYLFPGPKMMWQFDELGYDINIDFNGRTGRKPLPWGEGGLGYYEDSLRQHIYDVYSGILDVRNHIGPDNLAAASTNHQLSGQARRISYDTDATDLVVIGNFGLTETTIDPSFSETGSWFDYFSGEEFNVSNPNQSVTLKPGQWHLYTSERLSDGIPGAVEIFDIPVTITPYPFTRDDEITLTFDATKAWVDETAGLEGAEKVYFHSGVVQDSPDGTTLQNVVGTLTDDGVGEMTNVGGDTWEITFTPSEYYSVNENQDLFRIGMWFRDADNTNVGKGFRNSTIFFDIESNVPLVSIDPPGFDIDTEITITFNALKGNHELAGFDKVYMHSGVGTVETEQPWTSAWNNVVGNWGMDDGVGQLSLVPGESDLWEITLTPRSYYGLADGDFPYWIAMVFRSADGNTKGTHPQGEIENGIIDSSLDIFIQNQGINTTYDVFRENFRIYPNPTRGLLNIAGPETGNLEFRLYDISGKNVFSSPEVPAGPMDISHLEKGIYFYRIGNGDGFQSGKIVLQ